MNLDEFIYQAGYYIQIYKPQITLAAIFFLIFLFSDYVLKRTMFKDREQKGVATIVALVVAGLATFYLSESQTLNIISSYNIFGILIVVLIPAVIVLFSVHKFKLSSGLRRGIIISLAILFFYFLNQRGMMNPDITLWVTIVTVLAVIFDKKINQQINTTSNLNPPRARMIPYGQ